MGFGKSCLVYVKIVLIAYSALFLMWAEILQVIYESFDCDLTQGLLLILQ